jgi:methylated-DNA-[protein]-cysteine S-methyltransferase
MGYTLFDTAIGVCGIAWSERGVVRVQLPEATRDHFRGTDEVDPPSHIRESITKIRALLEGEHPDLSTVELDLADQPAFHRKVYEVARSIPPGQTLTYGDIAARVGDPNGARAVGQAMGQNPVPIIVPCHRVVAAGGKIGGFSGSGGKETKLRMLAIESRRSPALDSGPGDPHQ